MHRYPVYWSRLSFAVSVTCTTMIFQLQRSRVICDTLIHSTHPTNEHDLSARYSAVIRSTSSRKCDRGHIYGSWRYVLWRHGNGFTSVWKVTIVSCIHTWNAYRCISRLQVNTCMCYTLDGITASERKGAEYGGQAHGVKGERGDLCMKRHHQHSCNWDNSNHYGTVFYE